MGILNLLNSHVKLHKGQDHEAQVPPLWQVLETPPVQTTSLAAAAAVGLTASLPQGSKYQYNEDPESLSFCIDCSFDMVWAKYSLTEYLDPLG